jgi:putative transposase
LKFKLKKQIINFTHSQTTEILLELASTEDGMNTLMKLSIEALMKCERSEHNKAEGDLSNGFRTRRAFGDKKMIDLQVPRTRSGIFYPIIIGILKNQETEAQAISFSLYKNSLTTAQVGEILEEIYGKNTARARLVGCLIQQDKKLKSG